MSTNFSICYYCKCTIHVKEPTFTLEGLCYCQSCAQMMNEAIDFEEEENNFVYDDDIFEGY